MSRPPCVAVPQLAEVRQDPGGPQVGPMNFAIWVVSVVQAVEQIGGAKIKMSAISDVMTVTWL